MNTERLSRHPRSAAVSAEDQPQRPRNLAGTRWSRTRHMQPTRCGWCSAHPAALREKSSLAARILPRRGRPARPAAGSSLPISFAPNSPAQLSRAPERSRPAPPARARAFLHACCAYAGQRSSAIFAAPCPLHVLRPGRSRSALVAAPPPCTTTLQNPRAPRRFSRGTHGRPGPLPTRHLPFLCPKFPCQIRACSRAAPARAANQIPPVSPRQQRLRRPQVWQLAPRRSGSPGHAGPAKNCSSLRDESDREARDHPASNSARRNGSLTPSAAKAWSSCAGVRPPMSTVAICG